ncbi:hypothetical protein [Lentzea flava]|uniref:ATP-binding protein n=1 Tax=Lentzea flava TaxID=103732 RepID=A0ABQ2UJQ2_9PSEU|nr:hypothetical protein [Lentzea flava]GGU40533.1 hypothetical protein GCM10010178_36340 [Lentzea flava]
MSRSGLFRAAALLAAGAAPLLAGSANAVEVPQLNGGVPEVGADKVLDATQHANPLDSAGALKLGHVQTPVTGDVQAPEAPAAAQERSLPAPLASDLGGLPALPNADDLAGNAHVGGLKAPSLSDLPTNGVVPNPNVISGTLPTING